MYETRKDPLLARGLFRLRLYRHVGVALVLIAFSLGIGMWGYCTFEQLSLLDGFLNSAMLLGGMGPVNNPVTAAGKLFAGLYALYAGLVFLVTAGLLFAPLVHRLMHRFHWPDK